MKAPFVIDPGAGRVTFPDLSLEVQPGMSEEEFIAASASLKPENRGSNNGWQRYAIRHSIPQDQVIGIFFIFLHGKLNMLTFTYNHKDESWDTWSEATELAREKEYQQELAAQLGGKNEFSWGVVGAQLDRKSGGTDIWMRFTEGQKD